MLTAYLRPKECHSLTFQSKFVRFISKIECPEFEAKVSGFRISFYQCPGFEAQQVILILKFWWKNVRKDIYSMNSLKTDCLYYILMIFLHFQLITWFFASYNKNNMVLSVRISNHDVSSAELRWPISTLASRARGTSALSTSPALKNVCTNRIQTLFRTSEPLSNGQGPSAYIVDSNSIPKSSHSSPSRDGLVVSIFAYQSKGRGIEPRLERLWFSFMIRVSKKKYFL